MEADHFILPNFYVSKLNNVQRLDHTLAASSYLSKLSFLNNKLVNKCKYEGHSRLSNNNFIKNGITSVMELKFSKELV